jgi:hypothetical protein
MRTKGRTYFDEVICRFSQILRGALKIIWSKRNADVKMDVYITWHLPHLASHDLHLIMLKCFSLWCELREATPNAYRVVVVLHGTLDDIALGARIRCMLILQWHARWCENKFTNSEVIGVLVTLSVAQYFISQSGNISELLWNCKFSLWLFCSIKPVWNILIVNCITISCFWNTCVTWQGIDYKLPKDHKIVSKI